MNKYIRLDECCQIALSSIDKKSKSNEKPIKLCNFTDVYYNWNIYSSMTDEFMEATASDKNIDTFSLKQGDVVITKDSETRDDIGMAAFVYEDLHNTVLGYHCALIRPLHSVDGSYLNAFLNSYLGRKHFENQASGSGQRYTLTKEALGSIKIPLIPIHQQKAIGALFSNIEKRIHNGKQTISEFESLAKTIYDYWFLQFEFPNEDGKPYKSSGGKMVWSDELKREIPEGWKAVQLGCFADLYQPKTITEKDLNSNGKYFVYGANGIIGKYDKFNHQDKEIAICCRGANCGNYVMTIPNSWITGNSMVVSTKNKEFIYYSLSKNVIGNYITGSAQPQITRTNLESAKFLIPNSEILNEFERVATTLRSEMETIFYQNQELASLRDFLLPMLMNGQVTFKEKA